MHAVLLLLASLAPQTATEQLPRLENLAGYGQETFEPFSFVQIGDPQIGFGGAYPAARRLERLAVEIESTSAAFGVVVGDLVHDRTGREYRLLRAGLESFQLPLAFVPGNHDVLDARTLEAYRADFGRDYYSFIFNGCGFVAFNSELLGEGGQHGFSEDESRAQWAWLDAELAKLRATSLRHVFLFLHRPPDLGVPAETDPLVQRLRDYGIRHVLAGHWHTTEEIQAPDGAITVFTVGGTARVFDDRGYGYRVFDVSADGVDQRYVEFDRPSDHWLVRYGWSPRILDPSLPHWLLTLTFLVGAVSSIAAQRRARAHGDSEPGRFWMLLGIGYLLLAIDRQLDIDEVLQATGRIAISSLQAYGGRREIQVVVLAVCSLFGLIGMWFVRRQLRRASGRPWLGLIGFSIPATVFLLHTLSLHQVDQLLYTFGRGGLYAVEAAGVGLSCWAARH